MAWRSLWREIFYSVWREILASVLSTLSWRVDEQGIVLNVLLLGVGHLVSTSFQLPSPQSSKQVFFSLPKIYLFLLSHLGVVSVLPLSFQQEKEKESQVAPFLPLLFSSPYFLLEGKGCVDKRGLLAIVFLFPSFPPWSSVVAALQGSSLKLGLNMPLPPPFCFSFPLGSLQGWILKGRWY